MEVVIPTQVLVLLIILAIWELIWKGFALWKAAQRKENIWFIAILILNTAGILPIFYLIFTKKERKSQNQKKRKKRR